MDLINIIFVTICTIGFLIETSGFLIYKSGILHTNSWEETISKMFTLIGEVFYEDVTGKLVDKKIINPALILIHEEILELVKRLENNPFMTPALAQYIPNENGIMWVDIRAVKLIAKYKDLTKKELYKMLYHIIQNFYMEKRNTQVCLYIKVATPNRLYFAVALSEEGKEFLEKQEALQNSKTETPTVHKPLKEEVPPLKNTSTDFSEKEIDLFKNTDTTPPLEIIVEEKKNIHPCS